MRLINVHFAAYLSFFLLPLLFSAPFSLADREPTQPPPRVLRRAQSMSSPSTSSNASPRGATTRTPPHKNSPSASSGESPAATTAAARLQAVSLGPPGDAVESGAEEEGLLPGQPLGVFSHLAHYNKLHEALVSAYKANKITLKAQGLSRFAELVRVSLEVLAVLVEVEGSAFHRYAGEVLSYFQVRLLFLLLLCVM